MSAATLARRLDEDALITVFEKGPYVGFANCGIPYAMDGIIPNPSSLILQTPKGFKDCFNINVHLCTEVTNIDKESKTVETQENRNGQHSEQYHYDKLILAQGAKVFLPPIDGIHESNVFTLQTIPKLLAVNAYISANECKSVAVIGGGFIGLEAAENLRLRGLKVTIIEATSHVFPPVDLGIAACLHGEIRTISIRLVLNARLKNIESVAKRRSNHVILEGGEEIDANVVIVAVVVHGRVSLARRAALKVGSAGVIVNEFMQTSDPDIYAVGDMVETPHRVAKHLT
ncbi:hypothetical protein BDV96DRAFT_572141 [Lophiotrema nucula]|uniref:FAD/NAD(P)-binding domain-containing protein n=1 Tax=Lophiotrema nucula TaxID=690887 RepID=A0A6A5ZE35_9PLEO|nr:hypothetical protein BDV96DRAFT_572141 [Lophiotrema nucula]